MGILRTDKISGLETPTAVTGSVSFDGTGDYLTIPINTEFEVGADFTFETWIYRTSLGSLNTIYSYLTAGTTLYGLSFILTTTGIGIYGYNDGDSSYDALLSINGVVSTNEWHHVAVVRSNSTWYYYIDGVLQGSGSMTSFSYTGTPTFYIGVQNDNYANAFTGYLSNYRVVKGKALYTSDFTPPVHALEPIDGTVLLCCNNPDSAAAASYAGIGTSKTITTNGNVSVASTVPGLTRDFTFGTQFEGVTRFDTQGYFVPPSGTTEQRGRGRGVVGGAAITGGGTGTGSNSIEYITISSLGNSQDFGDLTDLRRGLGACASSTRGIFGGGYRDSSGYKRNIDFITISSSSNAINFGDLTDDRFGIGAVSNNTRGVFGGGEDSPARHDILDFVTIASLGNATDFGDLSGTQASYATVNSSIRGVFAGGFPLTNAIQYITIATTGDAQDFGDLSDTPNGNAGVSSPTRGVIGFGQNPALVNNIEFITIATTGNAQDFGDTTVSRTQMGGTSNSVRGVFIGGRTDTPTPAFAENTMDYVTIASTGNAIDFGDLIVNRQQSAGLSDSHGGLS